MSLRILVIVRQRMRTRAHQRHFPPDDVEELRQLVKAVAAQKPAERRDTLVVGLWACRNLLPVFQNAHGAKLIDAKHRVIKPVALLGEKIGPPP